MQRRYLCKFPASSMFSSATPELSAQGVAGGTPWGLGAASAESCTHPAKRDRCFPPPIAERESDCQMSEFTDDIIEYVF